jgi:hypothetical protein
MTVVPCKHVHNVHSVSNSSSRLRPSVERSAWNAGRGAAFNSGFSAIFSRAVIIHHRNIFATNATVIF